MSKRTNQMVVLTAGLGMFLSTLDTGIINVALPTLVQSFDSSISMMTWTITLYTLALVSTIIIFGRLSDRFGQLRIYTIGLIIFLMASIICGFAVSPMMLILSRTLQGVGAAMLQGTAAAIISTSIPKEQQGSAFGTLGVLIGLGPVLGPGIGGLLLSIGSWRWIFWLNIPFIMLGLIGCKFIANIIKETKSPVSINWIGNSLLAIASFSLLWGISALPDKGLWSFSVMGSLLLFILFFICFWIWERKNMQPILDLRIWKKPTFILLIIGIFVLGGSTSLSFIIPPYFLKEISQLASWQVGLVNLSAPLGLTVLSNISGELIEKRGAYRLMIYGLILMSISFSILIMMQATWSPILLVILLLLFGAGAGTFIPANTKAIMTAVGREHQGTIGAVQRMVQNLGIALYAAIASSFISAHYDIGLPKLMTGFREAWLFAAVSLLFVLFVFLYVSNRKRKKNKQDII